MQRVREESDVNHMKTQVPNTWENNDTNLERGRCLALLSTATSTTTTKTMTKTIQTRRDLTNGFHKCDGKRFQQKGEAER